MGDAFGRAGSSGLEDGVVGRGKHFKDFDGEAFTSVSLGSGRFFQVGSLSRFGLPLEGRGHSIGKRAWRE
jgi:hypothetical protein